MADNSTAEALSDWIECGYNWTGPYLGTTAIGSSPTTAVGFIACIVAIFGYGTNFVPFKFVKTADGIFAQWSMCIGIWIIGLIVYLLREQPIFYPWTLLGGAIWCIGNCAAVPIINLIGLSIGILIWNSMSVVIGWATGRFGLLGLCEEQPSNPALNYAGFVLCLLAGIGYAFVKTDPSAKLPDCCIRKKPEDGDGSVYVLGDTPEAQPALLADGDESRVEHAKPAKKQGDDDVFMGHLPKMWRHVLGVVMSVLSGCCYGVQFIPATFVQNHVIDNGYRASSNGLDYCFSHFCGILLASTAVMAGSLIIKRGSVLVSWDVVLPGLLSGLMWGISTMCFFVANAILSPAVSFPIITTVPGTIASLWGIFLFREIRGLRNFLFLGLAFSCTVAGALLTAFSK